MYQLARSLLFKLDPEKSHYLSLEAMKLAQLLRLSSLFTCKVPAKPRQVMGLEFTNPVGMAAGLDKNGDYIDALAALGFGFLEIGTVTPRPQSGNPQPRLFRLPEAEAIINRMGFNNKGVDHLVRQVQRTRYSGILGINIGKNFDTPLERAVDDYLICMNKVYPFASYITVNLSSPNTPGLRDLQFGEPLENLLVSLKQRQTELANKHGCYVPIAVKIAPDMANEDCQQVADSLLQSGIDAVIATNTTVERSDVAQLPYGNEAGGLSGAPLTQRANEVVCELYKAVGGQMPIIGVGGIMNGQDAAQRIEAGAQLVQVYSGFIYRGPELISEVIRAIESA